MSDQPIWYYLAGDERTGPLTADAIRQLIAAGVIPSSGLIAREGDPDWSAASSLELLLEATTTADAFPAIADLECNELRGQALAILGDWRQLPWAALLVASYFLIHLLASGYLFNWENPHPEEKTFAWSRVGLHLLGHAGLTMLPSLAFCFLQRFRSNRRSMARPVPLWSTLLVAGYWGSLIVGGFALARSSIYLTGILGLVRNFMIGAGGGLALVLAATAGVALVACSTVVSENLRRRLKPLRKANQPLPLLPLVADGWSKVSVLLLLTGAVIPVIVMLTQWPPKKNTDGRVASQIVRAIEAYQRCHSDSLVKNLAAPPASRNPWDPFNAGVGYGLPRPDGDIEVETRGQVLKLLNETAEENTPLGPKDLPPLEIHDMWGRPFTIVLDANGDGQVSVGAKTYAAKAAVSSTGWNGREDAGGWDDLVRLWK